MASFSFSVNIFIVVIYINVINYISADESAILKICFPTCSVQPAGDLLNPII